MSKSFITLSHYRHESREVLQTPIDLTYCYSVFLLLDAVPITVTFRKLNYFHGECKIYAMPKSLTSRWCLYIWKWSRISQNLSARFLLSRRIPVGLEFSLYVNKRRALGWHQHLMLEKDACITNTCTNIQWSLKLCPTVTAQLFITWAKGVTSLAGCRSVRSSSRAVGGCGHTVTWISLKLIAAYNFIYSSFPKGGGAAWECITTFLISLLHLHAAKAV